ncbi:hypothetical protein ACFL3C_04965 [Patescibacteria group bacterium]
MDELQQRTPEEEGGAGGAQYNVDAIRQSILDGRDYAEARGTVENLSPEERNAVEDATDQRTLTIHDRYASPEGTAEHPDVLSARETADYLRGDIGNQGLAVASKYDERAIMNAEAEAIAREQRENLIELKKEIEEALKLVKESRSMKIIGSIIPIVGRIWGPKRDERLKAKLEKLNIAGSEEVTQRSGHKNNFRGDVLHVASLVAYPPAMIAGFAFNAVGIVDNLRKFGELKGTRENLQEFLNQLNSGIDSISTDLHQNETRKVQYGEIFTDGMEKFSGINLN